MKKILKRVLLGIGSIIILIVLLLIGFRLKIKTEVKKMTPIETKEIVNNIFSIQDSYSNMYLIRDSSHYVAFDAGNDLNVIAEELKKLSINPEMVIAVFLTHTDGDHVAALRLFKNAKVYLSRQEELQLNGEKSRFLFFGNKIDAKEYSLIDDQQIINIGNIKIKGILTQGHTFGSMCYLVNEKFLFTGDVLSIKVGKIDEFNNFFNSDTKTANKSIGIITQIPEAEYIFTSHYGFTNDYKKAVSDWGN